MTTSTILENPTFTTPLMPLRITLAETQQIRVLYIGSNNSAQNKLSHTNFKTNCVANIHQAKKFLQLSAETNDEFEAIICDASVDEKSISHFAAFVNTNSALRKTVFILLYNNEESKSGLLKQNQEGIDDIVSASIAQTDLADKIKFLKKYKSLHTHLPYKSMEEANLSVNKHIFVKRLIDIVFSSLLLLLASPLLLIISLCIKLESKGPVFYRSLRAGTNYKIFTFFKFRTMVVNADAMVADLLHLNEYKGQTSYFFKIKDDPRVTKVGQFLRKTSLDELPQLINVLKGDMSLVGNRPLPLHEAQSITVDKSAKRFLAPAGITGLWQVKGRSNVDLSVDERIKMDIDYADNQSFFYDMKILLQTPKELILKNNV